jgi:hypothetical protein
MREKQRYTCCEFGIEKETLENHVARAVQESASGNGHPQLGLESWL